MGGFFVAVLKRKDDQAPFTAAVLRGIGKRAASQDLESSAPDAKRVKVICSFPELSSKQNNSGRNPKPRLKMGEKKMRIMEITLLSAHLPNSRKHRRICLDQP